MKQMFDISEKLIAEQSDEIYGVNTINWDDPSWKHLSLIGDEEVIGLSHAKVYLFSDSVLCLGQIYENPRSNIAWEERLEWFKSSSEYRTLNRIDGEPIQFEWNIFPGFNTLQLFHKVQELLLRLNETPENFTGRIIFMSMFNDISWGSRDNEKECDSNTQLVSLFARKVRAGQWSFLGPSSEKKWHSISEDSPQGEWDKMAEKMMVTLAESGHPVFRATIPLSTGQLKCKGGGKLSIHHCADQETITTVFRTITCVNQLSLYGAVAEMCEEYESCHDRTGRPVVEGQSNPLCVVHWEDERDPTIKYCLGRQIDVVQKVHHNTELWTQLMVSQWNSSGIFSQDSPHCSSATKSKSFFEKMSEEPEELTGRIIFMSMCNDIS